MTLFEPSTSSSLFRLPSLESPSADQPVRYTLPELKRIEPHFALPRLDEHAAGQDRMLVGLEEGVWWGMRGGGGVDKGKGKERARSVGDATGELAIAIPFAEGLVDDHEAKSEWDKMAERMEMGMEAEAGPSRPRTFKHIPTWDQFLDDQPAENPFVSEAGRGVFEAINIVAEPPLSLPYLRSRPPSAPINPEDLIQLMIRATMGTTITEALQWDRKRAVYTWGGVVKRAVGLSRVATSGAVQDFLDIATALRRLDQMLDNQRRNLLTPTHHALFHAVSTYLTFIKNRLSSAITESEKEEEAVSGWMMWKATLREVGELLKLLLEIMGWPLSEAKATALSSKPSSVLTHIYSNLLAQYQTSPLSSSPTPSVICLAYLLQASSKPFLKLLHAWVGLSETASEVGSSTLDDQPWADLGITRVARTGYQSRESGEAGWDYEFSASRMSAFIPKESRRKLFEAGRSLRLLREANGDHPLSGGDWGLEGCWGWGMTFSEVHMDVRRHTRRIQGEIEHWRRSVRDRSRPLSGGFGSSLLRTKQGRKERKRIPLDFYDPSASLIPLGITSDPLSPLGFQEERAEGNATTNAEKQLSDFLSMLNLTPGTQPTAAPSSSLWSSTPLDTLHSFLKYHAAHPILPASYPTFPLFISHHLLAPLLAHADLVSAALVSLYVDDLHLTDHLDIFQSFWLGGDVGFFERVSSALFGRDDQEVGQGGNMGRRARTRARMGLASGTGPVGDGTGGEAGEWGIALGVGLSDRRRWPPGGAELAYALRTTLLDDVGGHTGDIRAGLAWSEVEDRVSFAIMPLPEDEDGVRAKWMDPQAIEALDFLYLSYTPPASMSVVLPRAILVKYQTINNFLLRICRVNTVIRSMFHDLHKASVDVEDGEPKSGVDNPRPRSRRAFSSRPLRRALFSSNPILEKTVHHLRFRMSHFISALMRYVVDSAIGVNFDRMRKRLEKLKRRNGGTIAEKSSAPEEDGYSDFGGADAWAKGEVDEDEARDDGSEDEDDDPIYQLRSVHSLVAYHHITLDKILRSCLLAPSAGYDVAFKLLMRLFGLILDLGKVVKETERRMVDVPIAGERVGNIKKEWDEKEKVFMLALERLSQKHVKADIPRGEDTEEGERDMEALREGEEEGSPGQAGGLSELLLRLKLGHGDERARAGRWNEGI